jgi:hypothetical protein
VLTKKTVFVLGAGANVPYGFSTGAGLLEKARSEDPRAMMGNAGQQITQAQSDAFSVAARDNMLPSIDAMLEHRPDLMAVGKRVMATLLYREEAKAGPRATDEDWMQLVFQYMAEGADTLQQFATNPVTFVTFNYDRYLEHRFIRGLVARYRVGAQEAWSVAMQGRIIHVYGSLGHLPDEFGTERLMPLGTAVPLGAPDDEAIYPLGLALPIAEREIKIVHDKDVPSQALMEAHGRLVAAQQVLFFGFSFATQNVARLQLHGIPPNAMVMGTTVGMTNSEVTDSVIPAFPNRRMDNQTMPKPVRLFLRERIWLFR